MQNEIRDELFDARLNFSQTQQQQIEAKHLPHGVPALSDVTALEDDVTCRLHHEDFVSAYSSRLRMPLYSAFALNSASVRTRSIHLRYQPCSHIMSC